MTHPVIWKRKGHSDSILHVQEIGNQRKWDIRFLAMAKLVSTWSKDPSTKAGAVNRRVKDGPEVDVITFFTEFPEGTTAGMWPGIAECIRP